VDIAAKVVVDIVLMDLERRIRRKTEKL